jgi:hypothetical protein
MQTASKTNMAAWSPSGSLDTPDTDLSTVMMLSVMPFPKSTAEAYKSGSLSGASDSEDSFFRMASDTWSSKQFSFSVNLHSAAEKLWQAPASKHARTHLPTPTILSTQLNDTAAQICQTVVKLYVRVEQ